jgi:ribonuclease BN (tRNA processing enzyme)
VDLTILGRYSPYPPPGGACISYLLTTGKARILIECGSGAVSRLLEVSHWDQLSAVILSHLHGDHMSDMLVMRYGVWASLERGLRQGLLHVYCPAEPERERSLLDYKRSVAPATVAAGDSVLIGDVRVTFAQNVHQLPCLSMSFEHDGKRLVYSGDTEPNQALADLAKGADAFLCEATVTEDRRVAGHFVGRDLGQFAARAGVGQLLVTHFSTGYPVDKVMAEVRSGYPRAIEVQERATYTI